MRGLCAAVSMALVLGVGVVVASAQAPTTLTFTPAGNVGINTPTPQFKLDVQAGQVNASGGLCIAGHCKTAWDQVSFGSDLTLINGNVGVGTTTPAYKLDVQAGQVNAAGGLCIAGDCRTSWGQVAVGSGLAFINGNTGIGTATPGYKLDVQGGQVNASAGLCIAGECKTSWGQVGGGAWNTSGSSINYGGNVGIGTTTPGSRLEVVGGTYNDGIYLNSSDPTGTGISVANTSSGFHRWNMYVGGSVYGTSATGALIFYNTADPTYALIMRNSNVGVSVLNPTAKLHIGHGNTNVVFMRGDITGVPVLDVGYTQAGPVYLTTDGGRAMNLQTNGGNVGIGTTTPSAKLHVAGNVLVDGNIAARYQDVAEWVEADARLEAGTVVVADPDRNNRVRASHSAYDTAVAGVVSEQPGILLGEAGGDRIPVAQSGRVRVKVDASFGVIRRGDVLVSSPMTGYAMRSEPVMVGATPMHRPGTILGKALEPWSEGQGEVLVLLTLQ